MRTALLAIALLVSACSTDPQPPDAWLSEYSLQGADCPACPVGHDGHVCDLGPYTPDGGVRYTDPATCARMMSCGVPSDRLPPMGGYYCPHPDFVRCRNERCRPCAYEALRQIACHRHVFPPL